MVYLFRNGERTTDVTILYDKNLLPEGALFLTLDKEPEPPLDGKYVLCLASNASGYYWEKIPDEDLTPLKKEKIKRSKEQLDSFLISHPLYSNAHNQTYDYYTITEDKQFLLTSEFMGYQALKATGIEANFTWNAQGKPCEIWTEQEGVQLIEEIRAYVKPLVEYQQKKEILIQNAQTREEIENILIDYEEVHNTIDEDNASLTNNTNE